LADDVIDADCAGKRVIVADKLTGGEHEVIANRRMGLAKYWVAKPYCEARVAKPYCEARLFRYGMAEFPMTSE
jgi:hypothetical protein